MEYLLKTDPAIGNKGSLRTQERIKTLLTSLENNKNNFKTYTRNEKHF